MPIFLLNQVYLFTMIPRCNECVAVHQVNLFCESFNQSPFTTRSITWLLEKSVSTFSNDPPPPLIWLSITVNYCWLHAIGVALADYMPTAFYSVERQSSSAKCSDEFLNFTSIMILIRCFPIGICLPEMFYLTFLLL